MTFMLVDRPLADGQLHSDKSQLMSSYGRGGKLESQFYYHVLGVNAWPLPLRSDIQRTHKNERSPSCMPAC